MADITNFEHMKKYKSIYDKLVYIEDQLVMADATNIESVYWAFKSLSRSILEMLVNELVRAARLTDAQIVSVLRQMGKEGTVSLYGKIVALEKCNIISKQSADNMHHIRIEGNKNLHDHAEQMAFAKGVYNKLYRESYLFANQYMPEQKAQHKTFFGGRQQAASQQRAPQSVSQQPAAAAAKASVMTAKLPNGGQAVPPAKPQKQSSVAGTILGILILGIVFFAIACMVSAM